MTTYMNRSITAAGMVLALMLGPAHGASDDDAKAQRPREKAEERSDAPKKKTVGREFESCRRDARDLEGPERASFMTRCLHERR